MRNFYRLITSSKLCQCGIILIAFFIIYFIFTFFPSRNFTSNTILYHEMDKIADDRRQQVDDDASLKSSVTDTANYPDEVGFIDVLITFTKAKHNWQLQGKFKVTVSSMLKWTSVPLKLYIIGDKDSQEIAKEIISNAARTYSVQYNIVDLDVEKLAMDLHDTVKEMQTHFSFKPGAYYSDALFFLSIAIHRVMPRTLHKIIMLDADLKFNADIKLLYAMFSNFDENNVIGIARENQPVYRHTFYNFREKNPGTRVGDPPPDGLTGFNSGVLLLHLDKMRKSQLYNSFITNETVRHLTTKFSFKGHLGDQDFFTLLSMEHEELFYVLPCGWNRQLCEWWRDKGYESIFDFYFLCQGHISIYHGNCNTPIPKLSWENS